MRLSFMRGRSHKKFLKRGLVLVSAAMMAFACRTVSNSALKGEEVPIVPPAERPNEAGKLNFCAGIRGNGNYIFTHFGSIARILEEFGEIDAVAGGSSASITSFLYESMVQSKVITKEKGVNRNRDLALLMKSMMGYVDILSNTEQAQALYGLITFGGQVQTAGLNATTFAQAQKAAADLQLLLKDPSINDLINDNAKKMLENKDTLGYSSNRDDGLGSVLTPKQKAYRYKVQEVIAAAKVITAFKGSDPKILYREGVVSNEGLAKAMGGIGNFYAGVDPESARLLKIFVDSCAAASLDQQKTWSELREVSAQGTTCGELFHASVSSFWTRYNNGTLVIDDKDNRLKQDIGKTIPAFVAAAFLDGKPAVTEFKRNLALYRADQDTDLQMDFNNVRFGYFTPAGMSTSLRAKLDRDFPDDEKSRKIAFLNANEAVTWETALLYSPLEPGLGHIVPVSDTKAYIGGWADLTPVQILKAANCEHVIYISRGGQESAFLTHRTSIEGQTVADRNGVAELLGLTADQQKKLYLASEPKSSFMTAIRSADAVWCTDWDAMVSGQTEVMFNHAYGKVASVNGISTTISIHKDGDPFFTKNFPILNQEIVGCSRPPE